jgi:hypothetical protein
MQALEFPLPRRIMTQEFIGQANRAQRKADGIANVPTVRDGQLAAAAAQVHHQRRNAVHPRTGNES